MPRGLVGATPILERLWRVALWDIESNIQRTKKGFYFSGGPSFRATVLTRDIAYSGVLGLNRLYPELMRSSLEATRRDRREIGFNVSRGHAVTEIAAPWEETSLSAPDFRNRFHSQPFTRRTGEVRGSGRQLRSAAAFVNACARAGMETI